MEMMILDPSLLTPIVFIMVGCCSNVISLEFLIAGDAGAGNLITFAQFLFVSLEGLIANMERIPSPKGKKTRKNSNSFFPYRLKKRKIPLFNDMVMVAIFFLVSVLNNKALAYNISLPFHMIFRSGSLIANVIMGFLVFRKSYTARKLIAVMAVTVGIIIATFASTPDRGQEKADQLSTSVLWWWIGISMLGAALLLSAVLGLFQEWTYAKFGKEHYRESMFYSHALSLPFFVFLLNDMGTHLKLYNESPPFTLQFLGITAPILWWYLIANVLTQYICIRGVFMLIGKSGSSLTCTLVLSVRKFVSLIFSVVFFNNPFTVYHWIGTFLVFFGTFLYSWPTATKAKTKKKKQ